ncbi:hypothetical protein CM15mP43_06670 [bacterium]|nr:MAG: hypothetical protein CM15mP43_06670 [bacterium]
MKYIKKLLSYRYGGKNYEHDFKKSFFDSFFNNFGTYERSTSHYEVVENEGCFDIHIELPGIRKEHISLKVHENHLNVRADNTVDSDFDQTHGRLNKRYENTFKLPQLLI